MTRPNVVILNPDQMRWDYASCYGHPFIGTRHLEALAVEGTLFENAFVACPMCGPSRTSFITGQYPNEHGVRDYGGNFNPSLPNALSAFREAGYRVGLWGKDHIMRENAIGVLYDEGEDICIGNMDHHPAYHNAHDTTVLSPDSPWNLTGRLTDGGLDFIERQADARQPFLLTLNYQDPHPFFTCPEPWASLFHPDQFSLPSNFRREPVPGEIRRLSHWRIHSHADQMSEQDLRKAMAMYCGQIRYVDDQIGRVMQTLEDVGILDNTIVLFWSDHGELLGDYGVTHKLPAFYDSLVKVPLVLRDPTGRIAKGRNPHLTESMDIMALLLDLCGVPQPAGSRALSPLREHYQARADVFAEGGLICPQPANPIPGLHLKAPSGPTHHGPGVMLRTNDWKLVEYAEDCGELYDLQADPHEACNLYDSPSHADIRSRLQQRLIQRQLCKGQAPEDMRHG